jgi:REP element-mobilizing transposase RayT
VSEQHEKSFYAVSAFPTDMNNKKENILRPKFWHDRGYLPHFDGGEIIQFVTFRLADSIPKNVVVKLKEELEHNIISDREYHLKINKFLDDGCGKSYLKNEFVAQMIEETLLRFAEEKYKLISWVIMPNHVHLLLIPGVNVTLAELMHSIKSYTAHQANKILNRTGKFWSKEYFDRYMRDHEHYLKTIAYIENNPVKAGLCKSASDWRFGSARSGDNTGTHATCGQ